MATGIISTGLAYDGRRVLSWVLLVLTVVAFVGFLILNVWRLVSHRDAMVHDLTHPLHGFGFYTFVAAADVLAARIAADHSGLALGLLAVATVCWLLRAYAVPWTTRLGADERPVLAAANGSWFLWPVAGQSIAVAAAAVAALRAGSLLPAVAVGAWFLGALLYALVGVIVVVRLLVLDFGADDLTPPYWITMGAAAITALAGAEIILLPSSPVTEATRGVVHGGGLFAWVLATWLMPALFAAGWWRHVTHRVPLTYTADLWSIVFPLGMYAVASMRLGAVDGFWFLRDVGRVWIWVALAAWAATCAAGLTHVVRRVLLP
jgi:tellurite resistance protein TehA-like permease